MEWAALVTWIATAGGGLVLLGIWLRHGGMAQTGGRGRIRPAAILTHFALAATGLVLWIIYIASDSDALAWIAFILLLVVAAIGFGMFAIWFGQQRQQVVAHEYGEPAEQRFPTPVVGLHGLLAATTLVLVFLTAVGVGGS